MDFSYNPPIECPFASFRYFQDDTGHFAARQWLLFGQRPTSEWRKNAGVIVRYNEASI